MNETIIRTEQIISAKDVVKDAEVRTLIDMSDHYLDVIGYTDHGIQHVSRVARRAGEILTQLEFDERSTELARIASYLHDIGNVIHREMHPLSSAQMSFPILYRMGMPIREIAIVMGAIGNHDEGSGTPVSEISAALIIADKSDVLRSRVRNPKMISFDIHDRVNYAATQSNLEVDKKSRLIRCKLQIDTEISTVAEYFEIFLSRMNMCRRAAAYLNCDFALVINDVQLM